MQPIPIVFGTSEDYYDAALWPNGRKVLQSYLIGRASVGRENSLV